MPWRLLVDHAPTIVDAARRLYARSRQPHRRYEPSERSTDSLEALQRAVEQPEARDVQHAAVLEALAKQAQGRTKARREGRVRGRWPGVADPGAPSVRCRDASAWASSCCRRSMAISIWSSGRNEPKCNSCLARRFMRLEVDSSESMRLPLR